jgi:hypothetical protein
VLVAASVAEGVIIDALIADYKASTISFIIFKPYLTNTSPSLGYSWAVSREWDNPVLSRFTPI